MRTSLNVIFTAPFFAPTTLRFIESVADLPGVRLRLVSQDPLDRLPHGLAVKLAAHHRVEDGLNADQIGVAVVKLSQRLGAVHRLLGTLEELQIPLAEIRQQLRIDGMGVDAARNFRDKSQMKDVLRAAGIPCARHQLATSSPQALEFVQQIGLPVIAKPPAGAGARNTFRVEQFTQLQELLAAMPPSPERPLLVEEFIVGDEHSFDSVMLAGKPVWHAVSHYFPGPLTVLENPWIQWVVVYPREAEHARYSDIRAIAFKSLQALGMVTGLSHMEWFRRRDGSVAVSEVGARPPGAQFTTLMSYANDFDLYAAWARLMVKDEFVPPLRKYAAGAAFLRGQGEGRVVAIHGLDEAQRDVSGLVVEVKLPRAGQAASSTYEGDGYVIVRHPDTEVVEMALRRLVSKVRVELG